MPVFTGMTGKNASDNREKLRLIKLAAKPQRERLAARFYGFIASGKYFEGAQMLTVKLLQPRMRSSRMMRI